MMFSKAEFLLNGLISFLWFPIKYFFSPNHRSQLYQQKYLNLDVLGKVCIVTGSNTGIGKQTALHLACKGAMVILACRNEEQGKAAKRTLESEIKACGSLGSVEYIPLDLESFSSISAFAQEVRRRYQCVDILVNNAGLNVGGLTKDRLERLFQVNYLGHFYLTKLLIPLLRNNCNHSSESARVVNLSSVMHHTGQSDFSQSAFGTFQGSGHSYYDDSKLYMNFFTMEINRLFYRGHSHAHEDSRSIVAISVNPGAVRSDIWRHIPRWIKPIFDFVTNSVFLSIEEGCQTSLYAIFMPEKDLYLYHQQPSIFLPNESSWDIELFEREIMDPSFRSPSKKWLAHCNLPYIIPYQLGPPSSIFRLADEMMGPFCFPRLAPTSLPTNAQIVAKELWTFSDNLCHKLSTSF